MSSRVKPSEGKSMVLTPSGSSSTAQKCVGLEISRLKQKAYSEEDAFKTHMFLPFYEVSSGLGKSCHVSGIVGEANRRQTYK